MPLPLTLLYCNYAAQVDGLETWWINGGENDAAVDAKMAEAFE